MMKGVGRRDGDTGYTLDLYMEAGLQYEFSTEIQLWMGSTQSKSFLRVGPGHPYIYAHHCL